MPDVTVILDNPIAVAIALPQAAGSEHRTVTPDPIAITTAVFGSASGDSNVSISPTTTALALPSALGFSAEFIDHRTDSVLQIGPGWNKIGHTTDVKKIIQDGSYVGNGPWAPTTTQPITVAIPAGSQVGDLHVVVVANRLANTTTTFPAGWAQLVSQQYLNYGGVEVWWKWHEPGDTNISISTTSSTSGWSARMLAYRDIDATDPFNGSTAANQTTIVSPYLFYGPDLAVDRDQTFVTSLRYIADNNVTIGADDGVERYDSPGWHDAFDDDTTQGLDHSMGGAWYRTSSAGTVSGPQWYFGFDRGIYVTFAVNILTRERLDHSTDAYLADDKKRHTTNASIRGTFTRNHTADVRLITGRIHRTDAHLVERFNPWQTEMYSVNFGFDFISGSATSIEDVSGSTLAGQPPTMIRSETGELRRNIKLTRKLRRFR